MVQDPKFRVSLEALGVVEEGVLDAQKHKTFSSGWKTAAVVMLSVLVVLGVTVGILVVSGCHDSEEPLPTETPTPTEEPTATPLPEDCWILGGVAIVCGVTMQELNDGVNASETPGTTAP